MPPGDAPRAISSRGASAPRPSLRCSGPRSSPIPVVERRERDGASGPLVERDLEPICESYFDERELEVRFTAPYEASALFDVGMDDGAQAVPARRKEGRTRRAGTPPLGAVGL